MGTKGFIVTAEKSTGLSTDVSLHCHDVRQPADPKHHTSQLEIHVVAQRNRSTNKKDLSIQQLNQ